MRFFLLLVVANCLSINCISQTCVIAKITYRKNDTSIIIGSDTKFGNYIYNATTGIYDTVYTHGHKIYNKRQITYVTIGYGAEIQRRLADSVLNLHLSAYETLTLYVNRFERIMDDDLNELKKTSPSLYKKIVTENTSLVSSTMFAFFDHHYPTLCHLLFVKTLFGITTQWHNGNMAAGGELQVIQSKLGDEKTWSVGAVTAIKSMLKAEAIDRPDKVSLPFDFIIIHKNKVEQFSYQKY